MRCDILKNHNSIKDIQQVKYRHMYFQ